MYIPLIKQGSDDAREEALACAEMYRRFKNEKLYRRGVPKLVRDSTIAIVNGQLELPVGGRENCS